MVDSGPESDVTAAANVVLANVPATATVTTSPAGAQTQDLQSTTVTLEYPCSVPLGSLIVCGRGLTHTLKAIAIFPNQGSYAQSVFSMGACSSGSASSGGGSGFSGAGGAFGGGGASGRY